MNLNQIQTEILKEAEIDTRKVYPWIYNNQSIVFDTLLHDYFIGISYSTTGKSFNFILRNQSKVSQYSIFPKLVKYLSEVYSTYNPSINQTKTSLSFRYDIENSKQIKQKFIEILEVVFLFWGEEADFILNVEQDKTLDLETYLENPKVRYIGIKGNSSEFFLSYARNHDLNNSVYSLNKHGFIAVEYKLGISIFRKMDKQNYQELLPYFSDSFSILNNVFYTLEPPKTLTAKKKNLLVIFSNTNKSNENLIDRYYSHPFPFIANSIIPNTYIVRICDMADAFGSHGLNTKFDDSIEDNIQLFIQSLMKMYGIEKKNVIIMGASSGGTGAVYHGLIGGYKTLAIDPFLGNHDYYDGKDPLYLHSIRKPIKTIFAELPSKMIKSNNQIIITSSKASEFYTDINKLKNNLPEVILFEVDIDRIQKHTDVSPNTVFLSNTIINNLLLDIHITDSYLDLK